MLTELEKLILEISYDLPHQDVKREESYFSDDYIPILNMTTVVGNVIHKTYRDMEQVRWRYITEIFIHKTLERIFIQISKIMFNKSKHYG